MSYVDIIMFQDFFWNLIKKESIVWNERIWIWNWNGRMHVVGGGRWACINIWLIGNQRILERAGYCELLHQHIESLFSFRFLRKHTNKSHVTLYWRGIKCREALSLFVGVIVRVFVQLQSLFGQNPNFGGSPKLQVKSWTSEM